MTRFSSAPNTAEVQADNATPVGFVDLDLPSGRLRANTSIYSLSFGGNTYLPVPPGMIGLIESIKEDARGTPLAIEMTLSGVDNSLISATLADKYHGRSAAIYTGWLDENGSLVDTPQLFSEGPMDVMTIQTDMNMSTIKLTAENRLIRWNRSSGWMNSQEHHAVLMGAGDNFFDRKSVITNQILKWGDSTVTNASTGGGFFLPGGTEPRTYQE